MHFAPKVYVCVFFAEFSQQTPLISRNVCRLVIIIDAECMLSCIRTESLHIDKCYKLQPARVPPEFDPSKFRYIFLVYCHGASTLYSFK